MLQPLCWAALLIRAGARAQGWEEIRIPAQQMAGADLPTVRIDELPEWARTAFPGVTALNKVQSALYKAAFEGHQNLLLCAPTGPPLHAQWTATAWYLCNERVETLLEMALSLYNRSFLPHTSRSPLPLPGAGKTNVAMLCVLHEIGLHMIPGTTQPDINAFKIVYIAPMKSLVAEMVLNFGTRLKPYGITVRELTGDMQVPPFVGARAFV